MTRMMCKCFVLRRVIKRRLLHREDRWRFEPRQSARQKADVTMYPHVTPRQPHPASRPDRWLCCGTLLPRGGRQVLVRRNRLEPLASFCEALNTERSVKAFIHTGCLDATQLPCFDCVQSPDRQPRRATLRSTQSLPGQLSLWPSPPGPPGKAPLSFRSVWTRLTLRSDFLCAADRRQKHVSRGAVTIRGGGAAQRHSAR